MTGTTRRTPSQERSKDRLASIIAAAEQHLAEVGRDRFVTSAVAEISGASIGTVYRYFADRTDLLAIVDPLVSETWAVELVDYEGRPYMRHHETLEAASADSASNGNTPVMHMRTYAMRVPAAVAS